MIEFEFNPNDVKKAFAQSLKLGKLKGSIRGGTGNLVGFLGEILVAKVLKAKKVESFDFDLKKGKTTYEVKTKECSGKPKPEYFCSVSSYNTKQKCDFYVFTRIQKGYKKGWVLGYISREQFYKKAKFYKKGEKDPSSNLGWTFRADCYNLEISRLKKIKEN